MEKIKLDKTELMKKVKLKGTRVELDVDDFIEIFSDEENNKDIITRIKDLAKNGVSIFFNTQEYISNNEIIDKENLNIFELSYKNAVKNGIKCRYGSCVRYGKGNTYSDVNQTIKATKKINDWVDEIKNARVDGMELTPFEKFLYAYEIVTQFQYIEEDKGDNSNLSRHIINVLNGNRIVCAGYEAIFRHILNRLDINCSRLLLYNTNRDGGHGASLVYLNDPVYNINGIFVSEPTWGAGKASSKTMGRQFLYAFLSIEQAKKLYGDINNLIINDETIYESRKELFESVFYKQSMMLHKKELEEAKARFLENFEGFIVENKNYKRVKNEIKHIAKTLKLRQNDIAKNYKENRVHYKKDKLYKKLLDSTISHLDDFYEDEKFDINSPIFDSESENIIENLLKSKYSVEEISQNYLEKLTEFSKKSKEEKLKEYFDDDYSRVEDITSEEAERLNNLRDDIVFAREMECSSLETYGKSLARTRFYFNEFVNAMIVVGLAKGMSELGAKVYSLGRKNCWKDDKIKKVQAEIENDKYYENMDIEELERHI